MLESHLFTLLVHPSVSTEVSEIGLFAVIA